MSAQANPAVMGFVLAGGLGKRMGSPATGKAGVALAGRRLIDYPLAALAEAGIEARVVAKRSSPLPEGLADEVAVVWEPEHPLHPLAGICAALAATPDGFGAIVLGCDTPLVSADLVSSLCAAPAPAVVRSRVGRTGIQPLIAHYSPGDRGPLESGLADEAALIETVARLDPGLIDLEPLGVDATGEPIDDAFNVNSPDDLAIAERLLAGNRDAEPDATSTADLHKESP